MKLCNEKSPVLELMMNPKILGNLANCNDFDLIYSVLTINPFPVQETESINNDFLYPIDSEEWLPCPKCGEHPKIWTFDNGKFTKCNCYNGEYNHFSIRAESICSYFSRMKTLKGFDESSDLKKFWNLYCEGKLKENFRPVEDEHGRFIMW